MAKKIKHTVLIIDDHPLIIEAYKSALTYISTTSEENFKFEIDEVDNCEEAYEEILKASKGNGIDIIFLDIKLPPSSDGRILSGEDLGLIINEELPKAKIIVSTTFNDNYRVHSIFKNVDPDGFLVKNDINPQDLVSAIKTVIKEPPYYSKTIIKLLRKEISSDFILDKIDRKLLYEISIGTKMKDLPNILPLTLAGIERRKRRIKDIFGIGKQEDKVLVLQAKEKGFI